MRQKKRFLARFGEKLDVPSEVLPGGFSISMFGQNELCACGCERILEYGENKICLLLGKRRFCISGSSLLCVSFSSKCITVTGCICELCFLEGDDAD